MLDLDFCLTNCSSNDVELDSFEDNPFCLDFSCEQEAAELISPSSSEDEHEDETDNDEDDDDNMTTEYGGEESSQTMIHHEQPAAVRSFSMALGIISAEFDDLPDIVEDVDELSPFELLLEEPNCSSFDQDIVNARRKLDECMRRTDTTRQWINQYVKKPQQEQKNSIRSVSPAPPQKKKKSITKKVVTKSTKKVTKKRTLTYKKSTKIAARQRMVQYKKTAMSSTAATRGPQITKKSSSINYECSGVLPLRRQVSDSSMTMTSSKPTSISDFLRNSRKSALLSIYN